MLFRSVNSSGIEITEAHGDDDVFPSSSFLRECVSLEGCELATQGLLNATKASPSSLMNRTTKGLVHLPLSESFEAESGAFTTTTRGTTHKWIGGFRMATSDHKRSQPPQWRLGSNDPRVTSSQTFNFHESSWRAQTDAQSNGKSTSDQILHSQIPPKATNAYVGRREKEQRRTQQVELQNLDPKGSPHLEERWIGGNVDLDLLSLFPQRYERIMGGIERWTSFPRSTMEVRDGEKSCLEELLTLGKKGTFL